MELTYLVDTAEVIVWGTVLEADDAHQNGTFLVEEYWKGTGGQHLLINQYAPGRIHYLQDASAGGVCDELDTEIYTGQQRVLFLYRNFDGSYGTVTGLWDTGYIFDHPDSALAALREEITAQASTEPHAPDYALPHLPAPILIKTEAQSVYLLPVDQEQPVLLGEKVEQLFIGQNVIAIKTADEFYSILRHDNVLVQERRDGEVLPISFMPDFTRCEQTTCFAFAPAYNFVAYTVDSQTIRVCAELEACESMPYQAADVTGQAFQFSPNGRLIAIWQEQGISIYEIRNQQYVFIAPTTPIHEINTASTENLLGQGVWSPDSTWLAYSDSQGLWLRDLLLPTAESILLLPAGEEGMPIATGYSAMGQYLHIIRGDERLTYHIRTQTILADVQISPDEQLLVPVVDAMLMEEGRARWFWTSNGTAIFMFAADNEYYLGEGRDYDGYFMPMPYDELSPNRQWMIGLNFDYEPLSGAILIHNDAAHISINGWTLDLAPDVDSEIVSVEWLPAMFYEE